MKKPRGFWISELAEEIKAYLARCEDIRPLLLKRDIIGPWINDEDDRVEFKHEGLNCIISRNNLFAWCGYVGVPESHKLYKLGYDHEDVIALEIHGGITYAQDCRGLICHQDDEILWWFGFDCVHAMDLIPLMSSFCLGPRGIYRDQKWVMEETKKLANQLAEIK